MGNSLSPLQKQRKRDLIYLLHRKGHHDISDSVEDLLREISAFCSWYPEGGSLKLSDWDKIGNKFHKDPVAPLKSSIPGIFAGM